MLSVYASMSCGSSWKTRLIEECYNLYAISFLFQMIIFKLFIWTNNIKKVSIGCFSTLLQDFLKGDERVCDHFALPVVTFISGILYLYFLFFFGQPDLWSLKGCITAFYRHMWLVRMLLIVNGEPHVNKPMVICARFINIYTQKFH